MLIHDRAHRKGSGWTNISFNRQNGTSFQEPRSVNLGDFMDKVGKKMHFGAFWSKMELGMHVTYLGQSGWTNLRTKEAKNVKNYGPKDEELSPKICHPNLPSLPCKTT
ncbi:unnamed protein product [Malus baccata var. baccata]